LIRRATAYDTNVEKGGKNETGKQKKREFNNVGGRVGGGSLGGTLTSPERMAGRRNIARKEGRPATLRGKRIERRRGLGLGTRVRN